MKKVLIGTPFANDFCYRWFAQSLALTQWPEDWHVEMRWPVGHVTPAACNLLADEALRTEADYLVLTSNDVGWEPDAFKRLYADDKDIVAAWGCARCHPHRPHVYDKYDPNTHMFRTAKTKDTGLEAVSGFGGGIWLIKTDVLRKIPFPWFAFVTYRQFTQTEDFMFCLKAQACGYECWVDWGVTVVHATTGYVTRGTNLMVFTEKRQSLRNLLDKTK